MMEKPLAERIDRAVPESGAKPGVAAALAQRPVLTAGAVLVGAGLAYAAVRWARSAAAANGESEVARDVHLETSIAINAPARELYDRWRDLKNLPLFMQHLLSVKEIDHQRSHWVAQGVAGTKVSWDAEIYQDKPGELIAWRSLDGEVVNAGSVRFEAGPKGHGTYVRVTMNYNPPLGAAGEVLTKALGADPARMIQEDLRRFKQLVEAGEVATIEGQSSGRAAAEERKQ